MCLATGYLVAASRHGTQMLVVSVCISFGWHHYGVVFSGGHFHWQIWSQEFAMEPFVVPSTSARPFTSPMSLREEPFLHRSGNKQSDPFHNHALTVDHRHFISWRLARAQSKHRILLALREDSSLFVYIDPPMQVTINTTLKLNVMWQSHICYNAGETANAHVHVTVWIPGKPRFPQDWQDQD